MQELSCWRVPTERRPALLPPVHSGERFFVVVESSGTHVRNENFFYYYFYIFFFLTTCHLHLSFLIFFSNFQQGKRGRSDSTKRDNCTDCEAGKYTDSPNAVKCQACNPGEYQKEAGKTACLPCLPGKYGRADRKSCDKCANGTASDQPGLDTPCPACPTGRAQEGEGNTACSACLAGTFRKKNSDDEITCIDC